MRINPITMLAGIFPFLSILYSCNSKQVKPSEIRYVLDTTQILKPGKIGSIVDCLQTEVPGLLYREKRIECTGTLEVPPDNIVSVTVPFGGYLRKISCQAGEFVKRGQTIAIVENPEYLKLQQEFLEKRSQWEYLREDFKRQGELTVENAVSVKTMQRAQASYLEAEAGMIGLKKQLEILGVNCDTLNADNITSSLPVKSPVSGYIAEIPVNKGAFIDAQGKIFVIIVKSDYYVKLSVNVNDIEWIKEKQKIEFTLVRDTIRKYLVSVKSILPQTERQSDAFTVYSSKVKPQTFFNPGMKVIARIFIGNSKVLTIPLSAVTIIENQKVAFIKTTEGYKQMILKNAVENNGKIELEEWSEELINTEFVTKGTDILYALFSFSKKNDY